MKMKPSVAFVGPVLFVLLCSVTLEQGYAQKSALDAIRQNQCICPCGNPYGGKRYEIPNQRLNWFDAVAYCNSIGMSIVTIKDASERRLLDLYLTSSRNKRNNLQLWIGANNLAPGAVRWGLTDQEVKLEEVNMLVTKDLPRFCVFVAGWNIEWVAAACDGEERQFICEY
uniref:C-type lectin domain-containing protein n=1 Tax=Anopheles dirus TaxID=7168 RepID=A0A182N7X7_9DIPT